ncbi:MAG: transcription antitermination factor NusB, partial [Gammaproteobacteria bacterium]|nr:transcription antitermination factor NusB [Gammaproteobacteria bacterium]MCW8958388.1 transcription antitermination factor NusB [Gammaproteobacteria bacterium]
MSRARSLARERAMQALYQWQLTGQELNDIDRQFMEEQDMKGVDKKYFKELLHEIPRQLDELDAHGEGVLDRTIEQVDPVERAILRIGIYELQHRIDIPYRVVINEMVELAKIYGAEQGHKYINGILDKLAARLRSVEV